MKNIFLKLLFLIGIVFLFKSTIYADTYMYTKRDSILRNNYSNLTRGNVIKVRGKAEKRLNEVQVIVDRIRILQGEENEE